MVLKIKANFNIEKPINFVNIISSDKCLSNTQFNIEVFENSKLHIRQYFLGSSTSNNGFINHRNEVLLKSNSSLTIDKFQDLNNNFNFCNEFIDQEKDAGCGARTFKNGINYEQIKNSLEQINLFDDDFNDCDSGYCGL